MLFKLSGFPWTKRKLTRASPYSFDFRQRNFGFCFFFCGVVISFVFLATSKLLFISQLFNYWRATATWFPFLRVKITICEWRAVFSLKAEHIFSWDEWGLGEKCYKLIYDINRWRNDLTTLSKSTEHVSESSQYVSELDVSETTRWRNDRHSVVIKGSTGYLENWAMWRKAIMPHS